MSVAALLVAMAIGLSDPPAEHPYAKAKVGDSVTYKMTMAKMPGMTGITQKKTVSAKTDDTVTLTIESGPTSMRSTNEVKINLKEKFDPSKQPDAPKDVKSEIKKVGEGKEKVTIGGKSYDCTWTSMEITATINGTKYVTRSKTWASKDVPLEGLVKSETETDGHKTTMELVEVTNGK